MSTDTIKTYSVEELNKMDVVQLAAVLRARGWNIMPIIKGTKLPRAAKGEVDKWKVEGCHVEIRPDDSIAVLHGPYGGTWAVDYDDKGLLSKFNPNEEILKETIVVITPKKGNHQIFRRVDDDVPSKDSHLMDKKGREIDIRAKGYTLLPPSIHDELDDTYKFLYFGTEQKLGWSGFLESATTGKFFFVKKSSDKHIHSTGDAKNSKYTKDWLMAGEWEKGERRACGKSLYCKLLNRAWTDEKASEKIHELNKTCSEPQTEDQVNSDLEYVRTFYEREVLPTRKALGLSIGAALIFEDMAKWYRWQIALLKARKKNNAESHKELDILLIENFQDDLDVLGSMPGPSGIEGNMSDHIVRSIKKHKTVNGALMVDLAILQGHHFAHKVNGEKGNLYVYDDVDGIKFWNPNVADWFGRYQDTLGESVPKDYDTAARLMIQQPQTLQVVDHTYHIQRAQMIIDPYGNYYNPFTGHVHEIDPSVHFYELPDTVIRINKNAKKTKLKEFLNALVGKDKDLQLFDAMARIGSPAWPDRNKATILTGEIRTNKSTITELILMQIWEHTGVTIDQIGKDNFAAGIKANSVLNVTDEQETNIEHWARVKQQVTQRPGNKFRVMHSQRQGKVYRTTVEFHTTNEMLALGDNVNIESMLDRFQVFETQMDANKASEWNKYFDTNTAKPDYSILEGILWELLQRQTEIIKSGKVNIQGMDETAKIYDKLTTNKITELIDKNFDRRAGYGVGVKAVKHLIRDELNISFDDKKFTELIQDEDLDVDRPEGYKFADNTYVNNPKNTIYKELAKNQETTLVRHKQVIGISEKSISDKI